MLNKKLKYWLPVILWMGLIFFLSCQPDLKTGLSDFWDTILQGAAHFVEYAILSYLLCRAFEKNKKRLIWALLITIAYAISDEYHQTFVPGRFGSLFDVLIDSLGGLVVYLYYLKISAW